MTISTHIRIGGGAALALAALATSAVNVLPASAAATSVSAAGISRCGLTNGYELQAGVLSDNKYKVSRGAAVTYDFDVFNNDASGSCVANVGLLLSKTHLSVVSVSKGTNGTKASVGTQNVVWKKEVLAPGSAAHYTVKLQVKKAAPKSVFTTRLVVLDGREKMTTSLSARDCRDLSALCQSDTTRVR